MISPLAPPAIVTTLPMPGLEADNLLAFIALLGLLRALETARPVWDPRVSWGGSPLLCKLHLSVDASRKSVAIAAGESIDAIVDGFEFGDHKNVDFDRPGFRLFARNMRDKPATAALAAALTSEWPEKKSGGLQAAPLVMMFGQGHQNFLERLVDVPKGSLGNN